MNADTKRILDAILHNGYYVQGTTMGGGGWPEFYRQTQGENWGHYELYMDGDNSDGWDYHFPVSTVTARNVQCAKAGLESDTNLDYAPWHIVKVTTTYETIEESK